jgi:cytochrome P450
MPTLWGPDASEWRPERWLDGQGHFLRQDPYKFVTFQAGPRICLGVDMALLEMRIVIAKILRRFRFRLLREPKYRTGLVLQMADPGLLMTVQSR